MKLQRFGSTQSFGSRGFHLNGCSKQKLARTHHFTVAARCFEKAVSIYPQFAEARLRLGTAYMDLGEWDKAELALLATLKIDARAFNALFALSEIYLQENKIADAEKVLVQGLAIQDQSF